MRTLRCLETLGSDYPATQYQVPEEGNPTKQLHMCISQNGTKANMDVWTYNMGLCCSLQFSRYPATPSKDSPSDHRCPMVCNKSYPTYGPTHPASTNGFPGTSRNSSHSSAITAKPPHSTNPRNAEQKATTKKIDTRCALLR